MWWLSRSRGGDINAAAAFPTLRPLSIIFVKFKLKIFFKIKLKYFSKSSWKLQLLLLMAIYRGWGAPLAAGPPLVLVAWCSYIIHTRSGPRLSLCPSWKCGSASLPPSSSDGARSFNSGPERDICIFCLQFYIKIWWATIYTWRITFKLSELQIKLQIGRMSLNIFNNAILFTYELICYAHILNHMNDTEYFFSNYLMIYGLLSFCCYANWYHFKLKSISPSGWSWIMNSISPLLIWFITRADCMIAWAAWACVGTSTAQCPA